jgi:hypothetical protein
MPEQTFTMEQIKEMGEVFSQIVTKHAPAAGAPTFNYAHGTGGMFSEPGVRPDMYNATVAPMGFLDALPFAKSEFQNELISILTGQLGAGGSNASNVCGDPPYPGDLKKCTRTLPYGTIFMKTKKLAVPDIGELANRADVERQINNAVNVNNPMLPDVLRNVGALNFRSAKVQQLYMLSNQMQRSTAPVAVTGNNTLAAAATTLGWIAEYDGIDRLIKAGHVDAATSTACPAADSHIITWGRSIDGTLEGLDIAKTMNDVYFSRWDLARRVGMDTVQWAWVMDSRLFRALTFVFACTFQHERCTDAAAGTPINREMQAVENRMLEMANGQFLWCNNVRVPVLFTSGSEIQVPDLSHNGLIGDVYLVPMRWAGGDLTWMDYFPMDNQYINEWNDLANSTNRVVHNNGMFMTAVRSDGFCDELLITAKFRMIMRTPFLAARIDNITFNSYKGYRDYEPGASFHYDGGVTFYTG